ncbi:hypothetical protein A0O34_14990 [Chryseobacterium glaciei]|uniref:Uncharacterized protein n=1 Tax=Chryseobacterium glaciei TaxID=1685010 RepID=A0A172XXJ3_9FLAO|nr:hypothetical protein [Chryseobacterium glaciei]ANF51729.1 hypothetical protein A0O34_14990 [Chryseobacterium glaciei]
MKKKGNLKKKYNAAYRLRKKLGEKVLPKRSSVIKVDTETDLSKISEVNILLSEFGFVIEPHLILV